jgi:hypothetical protein
MGVEFNDNGGISRPDFGGNQTPKFAAFLISKGLAKDVATANIIQVVFSLVLLAVSAYLVL